MKVFFVLPQAFFFAFVKGSFFVTDPRPIGILDSGFGGLSVACAIRQALPHEHLIYTADCGFAPWGDRTDAFINDRIDVLVKFLLSSRHQGFSHCVQYCYGSLCQTTACNASPSNHWDLNPQFCQQVSRNKNENHWGISDH